MSASFVTAITEFSNPFYVQECKKPQRIAVKTKTQFLAALECVKDYCSEISYSPIDLGEGADTKRTLIIHLTEIKLVRKTGTTTFTLGPFDQAKIGKIKSRVRQIPAKELLY